MAKLIAGNESIYFNYAGQEYSAQVIRAILSKKIVFTVFFVSADGSQLGKCQIEFCREKKSAGGFTWSNDGPVLEEAFVQAIGIQIVEHPSLLRYDHPG